MPAAGCRLSVPGQDFGGESPTGAPQEPVLGKCRARVRWPDRRPYQQAPGHLRGEGHHGRGTWHCHGQGPPRRAHAGDGRHPDRRGKPRTGSTARTGDSSSSKQPKVRQRTADTPSKEVRAKSRRRLKPLGTRARGFFFQQAASEPATRRPMPALEHCESASPECVIKNPCGDHVDQWIGRNIPGCM